jgi:hypothetical protein
MLVGREQEQPGSSLSSVESQGGDVREKSNVFLTGWKRNLVWGLSSLVVYGGYKTIDAMWDPNSDGFVRGLGWGLLTTVSAGVVVGVTECAKRRGASDKTK